MQGGTICAERTVIVKAVVSSSWQAVHYVLEFYTHRKYV